MSSDVAEERKYKVRYERGDLIRLKHQPEYTAVVMDSGNPMIIGDDIRWSYSVRFTNGEKQWLTHDVVELVTSGKNNDGH
jgi:hypothetical protein